MSTELLVWLIPLPPLLAFFIIILLTNKLNAVSHAIAVGAAILSWLGSMVIFWLALALAVACSRPGAATKPPAGSKQHYLLQT